MVTETYSAIHTGLLIGGDWIDGADRIDVNNPAHPNEVVGSIVRGTPADVDRAVTVALKAQRRWAALGYRGRAEILARCLDALDEDVEERRALLVRESGMTLAEADRVMSGVAARQRLTLELVPEIEQDLRMSAPHGRTLVTRAPYGVIVSIVPWNNPVGLGFLQIIPALLAGNAVIVKPPESCPLALTRSVALIGSILPPGVINVVTGRSAEIGDHLTTHRGIAKIAFTGSTTSGTRIMCNAAQGIKGVTLELGGNDPAIVLDDADLGEGSMERMVYGTFRLAGQVCMNIKRIYVPRQLEAEFVEAYTRTADRIVVGDGLDPEVTMGPVHNKKGLDHARELLADSERRGATITSVGQIRDEATFRDGYFLRPTVITNVSDDAPIWAEEQFAPLIPIRPYDRLDEAIKSANDSIFGLGGSVWGKDVDRALAVASRIEAGTIWVNVHGTEAINRRAPYGGIKQSGIGRRAGREGLEEYLQTKTLTTFE